MQGPDSAQNNPRRPITFQRIAPLLIVLLGFAVRIYAFDTTWTDGDRASPHGIGLIVIDAVSRGQFSEHYFFNDNASTSLPSPGLMSWIWAFFAIFDRSLTAAVLVGLLANCLAIAMLYNMGARLFGARVGALAAMLMACSNWGVYLARGTWHPSHLEISVIAAAWLLSLGIRTGNRRKLLGGYAVVALTAWSYFTALIVPFQALAALLVSGAGSVRELRRTHIIGMGLSLAAMALYVVSMLALGKLTPESYGRFSLFRPEAGIKTQADMIARDITPMNRDPIGHLLRLASNADYTATWVSPETPGYAVGLALNGALGVLISAALVAGLLRLVRNWRDPANRFVLTWPLVPLAALLVIAALKSDFRVAVYYLLVTAPLPYLAAALGIDWGINRVAPMGRARGTSQLRRQAVVIAAVFATLGMLPIWNFLAAARTVYRQPFSGTTTWMPLRWAQQIGRQWQRECKNVLGQNFWWELSLFEAPDSWRRGGINVNANSSAWTVQPGGGTCTLNQDGAPLPMSTVLPFVADDGSQIKTYRSLQAPEARTDALTVNLGWTLIDHEVTPRVQPGQRIRIRHLWRVDTLPAEAFGAWYYAPFVKLRAAGGAQIITVDTATSLEGWMWRPGEYIASDIYVDVPADLAPGDYTVESSLFDPNQKKNAVYFSPQAPGVPILTLERKVIVAR